MALLRFVVVTSVLVAFVAYYARPVFPDTASNHGLKTAVGLGIKFATAVSKVGELLGFSRVNITRRLCGAATRVKKRHLSIESHKTYMDGVEVLVFRPVGQSATIRPGIVHIHGGGWIIMSPDLYAEYIEELAFQSQSVVVSVNYRLAPEHPYPIPLEDCLTVTRHFLKYAGNYGVDENKIGVKGDSAGGNLAMAVALKLSTETDLPSLKFMSLDYPALQAFDFSLPSYRQYGDGPSLLTKRSMIEYWLWYAFGDAYKYFDLFYNNMHISEELKLSVYANYINKDYLPENISEREKHASSDKQNGQEGSKNIPQEIAKVITDPLYAPLMSSDEQLRRLPPAYVFNVEFDVLRDDGLIVATRLENAGVKVTRRFMLTEEHGYLNFVSLDPSIWIEINRFVRFFNRTLGLENV